MVVHDSIVICFQVVSPESNLISHGQSFNTSSAQESWTSVVQEAKKAVDTKTILSKGAQTVTSMEAFVRLLVPTEAPSEDQSGIFHGHETPDELQRALKEVGAFGSVAALQADLSHMINDFGDGQEDDCDKSGVKQLLDGVAAQQRAVVTFMECGKVGALMSQWKDWLGKLWPSDSSLESYRPQVLDDTPRWQLHLIGACSALITYPTMHLSL